MFQNFTNRQLFEKIIRSDTQAYEALYERMASPLMIYAYKRMQNDIDTAKDIVQEVFIQMWERRKVIDMPDNVEAFLYKSVLYNLLNKVRKEKNKQKYLDSFCTFYEIQEPLLDEKLLEKEFFEILHKEIESLPPKMREVFELRFYKQYSNEEVANELGLSKHTVATHMKRALKILRDKLGDRYFWVILFLIQ